MLNYHLTALIQIFWVRKPLFQVCSQLKWTIHLGSVPAKQSCLESFLGLTSECPARGTSHFRDADEANQWKLYKGKTGGSPRLQDKWILFWFRLSAYSLSLALDWPSWQGHKSRRSHASVFFHFYCCSPSRNAFLTLNFVSLLWVICVFISSIRILWLSLGFYAEFITDQDYMTCPGESGMW